MLWERSAAGHARWLTLKLEILVDFPASANVLLTQFTMMPSALSPPPSSSRTFSVYLKECLLDERGTVLENNLLLVQSFTFSSAATPGPGSGWGRPSSGPVHQCPRWRNVPICPSQRHSYSSPTGGRRERSCWEKRRGHAAGPGEEQVEPFGLTFFMLVPSLG